MPVTYSLFVLEEERVIETYKFGCFWAAIQHGMILANSFDDEALNSEVMTNLLDESEHETSDGHIIQLTIN